MIAKPAIYSLASLEKCMNEVATANELEISFLRSSASNFMDENSVVKLNIITFLDMANGLLILHILGNWQVDSLEKKTSVKAFL